jgi:hypothetical protein
LFHRKAYWTLDYRTKQSPTMFRNIFFKGLDLKPLYLHFNLKKKKKSVSQSQNKKYYKYAKKFRKILFSCHYLVRDMLLWIAIVI